MTSSIGEHIVYIWHEHRAMGQVCPGGPVREAVYTDDVAAPYGVLQIRNTFYICGTCHSVVPTVEVKHG